MREGIDNVINWFLEEKNSKRFLVLSLLALAYNILFFYIIAESGFSADDVYNSQSGFMAYVQNGNVWSLTDRIFKEWLEAGRFFPFANYTYILFYFVQSRLAYKLLIILSVFICIFLFGKCVEKLTGSKITGIAVFAVFPMCIQLTGDYDSALYCFHMLVQMTFIWSLLSLLCVMKAIDKHREKQAGGRGRGIIVYYVLSGIFLFMSLGTYETAFVLFAFECLAVWGYTGGFFKACRALIPDFVMYGLACIINIVVRSNIQSVGYDGITINLNIKEVLVTFAKQVAGTLPSLRLLHSIAGGSPLYGKRELIGALRISDIFMVILYVIIIVIAVKMLYKNIDKIKNLSYMAAGGIALLTLPALLISITAKYQNELTWGTSHLSAFVQSFGLAGVVTALAAAMLKKTGKRAANAIIATALIIGIPVLLLQQMDSRCSVYYKNFSYRYPMENIENAGRAGVFEEIRTDDKVIGLSGYYYDTISGYELYTKAAKREIQIDAREQMLEELNGYSSTGAMSNDLFAVNSRADDKGGEVIVSHIVSCIVYSAEDDDYSMLADEIKIYTSYSGAASIKYVEGGVHKSINADVLEPKYEKDGRYIYEFFGTDIDVGSIVIGY
ncbi:MAG: hypothetical protein Q4F11_03060 [Eubacteriales bacterium]|nr:hypothetical protein [Eubacteriales bacterium]